MTRELAELVFYSMVGKYPSGFELNESPEQKTSERVESRQPAASDLPELVMKMFSAAGINPEELIGSGLHTQQWPNFVPASQRGELGAAQFQAAVDEVVTWLRERYVPRPVRKRDQPLSDSDRRLMQDSPPHHGSVG